MGKIKVTVKGSHSYTPATCTKAKTCKICGATSGSALGHSYTPATCTKAKTCTRCGTTSGSALGHSYGDWTITKEATCTSTGSKTRTCKMCGKTETQTTDQLNHPNVTTSTTPATCTEYGTKTSKCSDCGTVLDIDNEYAAPLGHDYSNGICSRCGATCQHAYTSAITKAATCKEAGVKTYTCSICGNTYTEDIATTNHTYDDDGVCSICGDTCNITRSYAYQDLLDGTSAYARWASTPFHPDTHIYDQDYIDVYGINTCNSPDNLSGHYWSSEHKCLVCGVEQPYYIALYCGCGTNLYSYDYDTNIMEAWHNHIIENGSNCGSYTKKTCYY